MTKPLVDRDAAAFKKAIVYCNNSCLRKATRHIGQLFDDIIKPSGLKATQFGLLAHIKAMGAPTMKMLAEVLVMDLSALGHTLKPLVRDGFVELTPDEEDRRSKRVRLTELGEAKTGETADLWQIAQRRFDEALGAEKAEQLREVLDFVASDEFNQAFRVDAPPVAKRSSRKVSANMPLTAAAPNS